MRPLERQSVFGFDPLKPSGAACEASAPPVTFPTYADHVRTIEANPAFQKAIDGIMWRFASFQLRWGPEYAFSIEPCTDAFGEALSVRFVAKRKAFAVTLAPAEGGP